MSCRFGVVLLFAAGAVAQAEPAAKPLFTFGVIADVQYADKDTAGVRHYRTSLDRLRLAVKALNQRELAFTIQVGDFVDDGETSFDDVLPVWQKLRMPTRHVLGNHDFPLSRSVVMRKLGLALGYYDFAIGKVWRFVVLDGMDISLHGYADDHAKRAEARKRLATLKGEGAKNAQDWNGGIGKQQLAWLRETLADADANRQRVVVFCHFPILEEASSAYHLLWNHAEVRAELARAKCVVAWLNGHDHAGGYAEHAGIHHVTLFGMLEAPKKNSWAVVEVFDDRLVLRGHGRQRSYELRLRKRRAAKQGADKRATGGPKERSS